MSGRGETSGGSGNVVGLQLVPCIARGCLALARGPCCYASNVIRVIFDMYFMCIIEEHLKEKEKHRAQYLSLRIIAKGIRSRQNPFLP